MSFSRFVSASPTIQEGPQTYKSTNTIRRSILSLKICDLGLASYIFGRSPSSVCRPNERAGADCHTARSSFVFFIDAPKISDGALHTNTLHSFFGRRSESAASVCRTVCSSSDETIRTFLWGLANSRRKPAAACRFLLEFKHTNFAPPPRLFHVRWMTSLSAKRVTRFDANPVCVPSERRSQRLFSLTTIFCRGSAQIIVERGRLSWNAKETYIKINFTIVLCFKTHTRTWIVKCNNSLYDAFCFKTHTRTSIVKWIRFFEETIYC